MQSFLLDFLWMIKIIKFNHSLSKLEISTLGNILRELRQVISVLNSATKLKTMVGLLLIK